MINQTKTSRCDLILVKQLKKIHFQIMMKKKKKSIQHNMYESKIHAQEYPLKKIQVIHSIKNITLYLNLSKTTTSK